MTEQQIDRERLRKLADAATPGPWVVTKCEPCAKRGREDIQIWDEQGYIPIAQWMDEVDPDAGEDAEFIAAARTAVPQLLGQLDQQEAELDSWMTRAYEAEKRAWQAETRLAGWMEHWNATARTGAVDEVAAILEANTRADQAEARIRAVRDVLAHHPYGGPDQEDAIRRALDGDA